MTTAETDRPDIGSVETVAARARRRARSLRKDAAGLDAEVRDLRWENSESAIARRLHTKAEAMRSKAIRLDQSAADLLAI